MRSPAPGGGNLSRALFCKCGPALANWRGGAGLPDSVRSRSERRVPRVSQSNNVDRTGTMTITLNSKLNLDCTKATQNDDE